jgi:hypothetical protein
MRFRTAFRLLVALLASTATLASSAVALAHGEAHEHALQGHGGRAHGAPAGLAPDAAHQPTSTLLVADDHGDHDALLHADCLARSGAYAAGYLGSAPVVLTAGSISTRPPAALPPEVALSPGGRAAPPDQPRAPPVG